MKIIDFEKTIEFIRKTHPDERTELEHEILLMVGVHKITAHKLIENFHPNPQIRR